MLAPTFATAQAQMPRPILVLFSAFLLPGCAASLPAQGYPRLVPLETLLIEAPDAEATPAVTPQSDLESRAAALRARAEALRRAEP